MIIDPRSPAASMIRRPPVFHKNNYISYYFNDITCVGINSLGRRIKHAKKFILKNPTVLIKPTGETCYIDNYPHMGEKYVFYLNLVYPHTSSIYNHDLLKFKDIYYYKLCTGSYWDLFHRILNEKKFLEMIYYLYDFLHEYNEDSVLTNVDLAHHIQKRKQCYICKKYNPYVMWCDMLRDKPILEKIKHITICDIGKCQTIRADVSNLVYHYWYDNKLFEAELLKCFNRYGV